MRGQIMLEFAVSLVGLVSLIVISLNVWHWMGRMLVERQDSFQGTRKVAGSSHPGQRVDYHRPPITLLKTPGSIDGDGALGEVAVPADSDCPAGKPFFDQAHALDDEATALKAQSDAEAQLADKASKKIYDPDHPRAGLKYQIEQCDSDDDDCIKYLSNLIQDAGNKARHHAKLAQEASDLASGKRLEMDEKIREGEALCNPPEPPPSSD